MIHYWEHFRVFKGTTTIIIKDEEGKNPMHSEERWQALQDAYCEDLKRRTNKGGFDAEFAEIEESGDIYAHMLRKGWKFLPPRNPDI